MRQNPWSEGGEMFSESVISKKSLSSPFIDNTKSADVSKNILIKEVFFSYYNKNEVLLLDFEEPHDVDIKYKSETTTSFKIDESILEIKFSPQLFIDGPAGFLSADYYLSRIYHRFSTAVTHWDYKVDSGLFGNKKLEDGVNDKIKELLKNVKKGTDLDSKNFKPFDDLSKLQTTISKAITNFLSTEDPPGTKEEEKNKAPDVDLSKFNNILAKATFVFKSDFIYNIEGSTKNYIKIAGNKNITCELTFKDGTLKTFTDYYNNIDTKSLLMDKLIVSLPPLSIFYKSELIITISSIEIANGGKVSISNFQLHGIALQAAASIEITVREILRIIAIKKGIKEAPIAALGASGLINSNSPKATLLNNFIKNSLETAIEESINSLLETSKNLIPGFDLKKFIGK